MIHLLDYLAQQCDMNYLSDLQLNDLWKGPLREINPSDFSLHDWNEAIHYLCDRTTSFSKEEEAKSYLLQWNNKL